MKDLDRMLGLLALNAISDPSLVSVSPYQVQLKTASGPVALFLVERSGNDGWPGVAYTHCYGVDFADWLAKVTANVPFTVQDAITRWTLSRWDPQKVRSLGPGLPVPVEMPADRVSWFIVSTPRAAARRQGSKPEDFSDFTRVTGAELRRWSDADEGFVPTALPTEVLQ